MTEEQQEIEDAYNEWLLMYGFRWVHVDTLRADQPLFWCAINAHRMDEYTNQQGQYHERIYQLKTSEQLTEQQNEIINQTRTTATTKETRSANPCAQ